MNNLRIRKSATVSVNQVTQSIMKLLSSLLLCAAVGLANGNPALVASSHEMTNNPCSYAERLDRRAPVGSPYKGLQSTPQTRGHREIRC
jgi:hypothetical protein